MGVERLTFHITDRCQLNCDHCLRDPGQSAEDIPVELVASILDQAIELYDVPHVGLTGGEPSLHPGFFEIIDLVVDRGRSWHMISNAERFDRLARRLAQRPERIAALTAINFSLDGAAEQTHDRIRERGNYRKVLGACSLCLAQEIPFVIQMTVNARNEGEIEDMAMLASHLGARTLLFNFTQPTGTFLDGPLRLPADRWLRIRDRIERLAGTLRIPIQMSDTFPHRRPWRMCEVWQHANLHIDYAGRLSLCCQHAGVPSTQGHSDVVADLRDVTLAEAHKRFARLVSDLMQARIDAVAAEGLDTWDEHFSCNWCLKHLGRPHWTASGKDGADAARPRWRGAWTPGYKESHQDADPGLVRDDAAPSSSGS